MMVWLLDLWFHWSVNRKLRKSLKPRPDLRDRRFREWSPERTARYLKAVEGLV